LIGALGIALRPRRLPPNFHHSERKRGWEMTTTILRPQTPERVRHKAVYRAFHSLKDQWATIHGHCLAKPLNSHPWSSPPKHLLSAVPDVRLHSAPLYLLPCSFFFCTRYGRLTWFSRVPFTNRPLKPSQTPHAPASSSSLRLRPRS
jgi:hypothetical protein